MAIIYRMQILVSIIDRSFFRHSVDRPASHRLAVSSLAAWTNDPPDLCVVGTSPVYFFPGFSLFPHICS